MPVDILSATDCAIGDGKFLWRDRLARCPDEGNYAGQANRCTVMYSTSQSG